MAKRYRANNQNDLTAFISQTVGGYPMNRMVLVSVREDGALGAIASLDLPVEVDTIDHAASCAANFISNDIEASRVIAFVYDGPASEANLVEEREVPMLVEIIHLALRRVLESIGINLIEFHWIKDGVSQSLTHSFQLSPVHYDGREGVLGSILSNELAVNITSDPLPSPAKSIHKVVQSEKEKLADEPDINFGEGNLGVAVWRWAKALRGEIKVSAPALVALASGAGDKSLTTLPIICSVNADPTKPDWETVERVENLVRKALPRAYGDDAAYLYMAYAWCRWASGRGVEANETLDLAEQSSDIPLIKEMRNLVGRVHHWAAHPGTARPTHKWNDED